MEDQATPANDLERALFRVQAEGDEASWDSKGEVLRQLALNPVYVIVDQSLDGTPDADIKGTPAFVSNGEDLEQAMLAIFSSAEKAQAYLAQEQMEGRHPLEVPGPRALLAVPDGIGIRVNPNLEPGFVILPTLAERLRDDVKQALNRQKSDH